jgi:hypothetical protein
MPDGGQVERLNTHVSLSRVVTVHFTHCGVGVVGSRKRPNCSSYGLLAYDLSSMIIRYEQMKRDLHSPPRGSASFGLGE